MIILPAMVRTRTFDPAAALTRAVDLFSSKGYSETSMEDIVQATGVSRYGLYGTFGSKRELFEQALERYADSMGKQSFLRLLEPDASLDHIRSIFAERVEDMCCIEENKGCLFIHTAMELAPQDEELREVLRRFMKRMSKAFAIGLESAKARGEVRADVDVATAGELLTSTMFGLAVLGRTGFQHASLSRIVDNTLASLVPATGQ
jgi:TetR/AcrR family transcriptional repressor of nem operon